MTVVRLATIALLIVTSLAACECERSSAPAESAEGARTEVSVPAAPPPSAEPQAGSPAANFDAKGDVDGVGGLGAVGAARSANSKASRAIGDDVVGSLQRLLFDGDALVVERNGVRRISCDQACGLEATCGFRDASACRDASCEGDVRRPSRMDYCLALDDSVTCLDAAACSCAESCWKRGECAKDHSNDDECERSCRTLVKQEGARRYLENRCVLESACSEIALCSGVGGP